MRSINRQMVVAGLAVLSMAFTALQSFACPTAYCPPSYGFQYGSYCHPTYYYNNGVLKLAPVQQVPAVVPNGGPIGVNPVSAVIAPNGPAAIAPVAPLVPNGQRLAPNVPQGGPIGPAGQPLPQNVPPAAPIAPNGQPGAPVGIIQ